jgi:hypothetical protein
MIRKLTIETVAGTVSVEVSGFEAPRIEHTVNTITLPTIALPEPGNGNGHHSAPATEPEAGITIPENFPAIVQAWIDAEKRRTGEPVSYTAIAKRGGMYPADISGVVRGVKHAGPVTAEKIARAFAVTLPVFLCGPDAPVGDATETIPVLLKLVCTGCEIEGKDIPCTVCRLRELKNAVQFIREGLTPEQAVAKAEANYNTALQASNDKCDRMHRFAAPEE